MHSATRLAALADTLRECDLVGYDCYWFVVVFSVLLREHWSQLLHNGVRQDSCIKSLSAGFIRAC